MLVKRVDDTSRWDTTEAILNYDAFEQSTLEFDDTIQTNQVFISII